MAVSRRFDEIVADKVAARRLFERREQAARFILDGLDGGDWLEVSAQIARKLTEQERTALLITVVKSLPDEISSQALDALFDPGVPMYDAKEQMHAANFWADQASPAEIRAFVSAGIKRMPPETRQSMRTWLNKGETP